MLFGRLKNAAATQASYADVLYSVKTVDVLEKMEEALLIAGFIAYFAEAYSGLFVL